MAQAIRILTDPTRDEMLTALAGADEFEVEAAIYWFAADWHGGQSSNLYSALSTSRYRPGTLESCCPDEALDCYYVLMSSFVKLAYERVPAPTCQIQWIDANGNPTPDNNPAIQRVRTIARDEIVSGRKVHFDASRWFCICAKHSKQLSEPGMHIWECAPLEAANG
jgi:hypothetical protein